MGWLCVHEAAYFPEADIWPAWRSLVWFGQLPRSRHSFAIAGHISDLRESDKGQEIGL